MRDGLYLNDVWVAEVDVVLNIQSNDLTKPDTLQVSYSNSFTLPDTIAIRKLLQNAEQLDSGGRYPYALLNATLVSNGEATEWVARLSNFQAGWSLILHSPTKGLFEALEGRKLTDLDLSRFNHPWTVAGMSSLAGASEGATYPVVDYGNFDGNKFDSNSLFPAVYLHSVVSQMLYEAGYTAEGDWLNDPLYKQAAIAFSGQEAQSRDEQWVADRTSFVTVATSSLYQIGGLTNTSRSVLLPLTVDNNLELNAFDGKQNNYNTTLPAYVCDTDMRLRVQASQPYSLKISYGAAEAILIIEKNGVNVGQAYVSPDGPYNITSTVVPILSVDELITCRKGDQIRLRFILRKRTRLTDAVGNFLVAPETTWASFTPDAVIRPGDTWLTSAGLPDMTQAELLKVLALAMSATYSVDSFRRTVKLIRLDDIVSDAGNAVDWSKKVDESEEPELSVFLSPYGQANRLNWQNLDKVAPFGNGTVPSPAPNLPPETTLFELPFAACTQSDKLLNGYGNPVLIQTRTVKGGSVELSTTTPRLILLEPSKTITVQATVLTPELTLRTISVTLTACWWGIRPQGAQTATNGYSLAFSKVTLAQGEQTMDNRYFSGLRRVLLRPRQLSVPVYLSPTDIANLDLSKPIRLQRVRAGALILSDGFYYLNKIDSYTVGRSCRAVLIPFY